MFSDDREFTPTLLRVPEGYMNQGHQSADLQRSQYYFLSKLRIFIRKASWFTHKETSKCSCFISAFIYLPAMDTVAKALLYLSRENILRYIAMYCNNIFCLLTIRKLLNIRLLKSEQRDLHLHGNCYKKKIDIVLKNINTIYCDISVYECTNVR